MIFNRNDEIKRFTIELPDDSNHYVISFETATGKSYALTDEEFDKALTPGYKATLEDCENFAGLGSVIMFFLPKLRDTAEAMIAITKAHPEHARTIAIQVIEEMFDVKISKHNINTEGGKSNVHGMYL